MPEIEVTRSLTAGNLPDSVKDGTSTSLLVTAEKVWLQDSTLSSGPADNTGATFWNTAYAAATAKAQTAITNGYGPVEIGGQPGTYKWDTSQGPMVIPTGMTFSFGHTQGAAKLTFPTDIGVGRAMGTTNGAVTAGATTIALSSVSGTFYTNGGAPVTAWGGGPTITYTGVSGSGTSVTLTGCVVPANIGSGRLVVGNCAIVVGGNTTRPWVLDQTVSVVGPPTGNSAWYSPTPPTSAMDGIYVAGGSGIDCPVGHFRYGVMYASDHTSFGGHMYLSSNWADFVCDSPETSWANVDSGNQLWCAGMRHGGAFWCNHYITKNNTLLGADFQQQIHMGNSPWPFWGESAAGGHTQLMLADLTFTAPVVEAMSLGIVGCPDNTRTIQDVHYVGGAFTWDAPYFAQITLTSGLTTGGGAITSLPTTALQTMILAGATITLTSGVNTQTWVVSARALAGNTSIAVTSQTPNFNYPIGSTVSVPAVAAFAVGGSNVTWDTVEGLNMANEAGVPLILADSFNGRITNINTPPILAHLPQPYTAASKPNINIRLDGGAISTGFNNALTAGDLTYKRQVINPTNPNSFYHDRWASFASAMPAGIAVTNETGWVFAQAFDQTYGVVLANVVVASNPPTSPTAGISGVTGPAAATYYGKVVHVLSGGGITAASTEVSQAVNGSQGIAFGWVNATSLPHGQTITATRVYIGATTGGEAGYITLTGTGTSIVYTGQALTGATTPPTTNVGCEVWSGAPLVRGYGTSNPGKVCSYVASDNAVYPIIGTSISGFTVGQTDNGTQVAVLLGAAADPLGAAAQAQALSLPLAGGTLSGALAMGSNKITGLANATLATDAVAFGQLPNITESRTFAISGVVAVPSGGTNYLPPLFEPVDTGTTKKLINVRYVIRAGTSVTFAVTQNGSNVSGLSSLSATTTAGATAPGTPPSVTDGDQFAVVVSAVSGSPDGLSVSLIFETVI